MTQVVGSDISESAPVRPRNRTAMVLRSTAVWIFAVDILLIIVFALLSTNHTFWRLPSLRNLAADGTQGLLLATAMAMLLGAAEFDISLGANLLLSSVTGGIVATDLASSGTGVAAIAGVATAVATGMSVGLVNGIVVTRLRVNSFICTLAMLGVATGVADIIANGTDLTGIPAGLQNDFGLKLLAGIPMPAFVALAVWALAWLVLRYTRFGLHLLALGSSRTAAERAGLPTLRRLTVLFVAAGALAGLAGFIDLTRFASTNLAGHQQDALAALTAAIIGGTSLSGGQVSMPGVLAGTLLAVILQDGLIVVGVSAYYQLIVIGAVLVTAVWLDRRRRPASGSLFSRAGP